MASIYSDELICTSCSKDDFTSNRGFQHHIQSNSNCQTTYDKESTSRRLQFATQELRQPRTPTDEPSSIIQDYNLTEDNNEYQMDVDTIQEVVEEEIAEAQAMFYFVEETVDVEIGEAGPGPATTEHRRRSKRFKVYVLDEEDDTRVRIGDEDAGKVIRMNETLHRRWRKLFRQPSSQDAELEITPTTGDSNPYAPFASELDWWIARWAVHDGIGHNSLDRLLGIPGVRLLISFSFNL